MLQHVHILDQQYIPMVDIWILVLAYLAFLVIRDTIIHCYMNDYDSNERQLIHQIVSSSDRKAYNMVNYSIWTITLVRKP